MKRYVLILIVLVILISIGLIFVAFENTDNTDDTNNIDNNTQIEETVNETEEIINEIEEIDNDIESDVQEEIVEEEKEYVEVTYKAFSADVIKNLNSNETVEISEVVDNGDGTVAVIFRKFVEIDVPVLTDEEYNLLMENKEIELFGEKFVLEYDSVLTNHNYVSFEFDENNNLVPYNGTYFCKGTDDYYTKIVSSDFKIDILPDNYSRTILEQTENLGKLDYLNIGAFWNFSFDEEDNLVGAEITW